MISDPYFNDIPWEIIYDDKGRVIGEVFTLYQQQTKPKNIKRK